MKIIIRQFHDSDIAHFYEAVIESREHLSKWLPWCTEKYSIEDAKNWVINAQQDWDSGLDYRFVIEDQDTSRLLGSVGISQIDHQHKTGTLGYWVRKSALTQGVCTRAAKQATRYAFAELAFQRIEIHVLTNNVESNAVATNIGAIYEGTFRNKLLHNGTSKPAKCYSIIPSDYLYPRKKMDRQNNFKHHASTELGPVHTKILTESMTKICSDEAEIAQLSHSKHVISNEV